MSLDRHPLIFTGEDVTFPTAGKVGHRAGTVAKLVEVTETPAVPEIEKTEERKKKEAWYKTWVAGHNAKLAARKK